MKSFLKFATGLALGGLLTASTDANAQRSRAYSYMGNDDTLSPATLTMGYASSIQNAPAAFIEFKKNMIEQRFVVGSLSAGAQFSGNALGSRSTEAVRPASYYSAVNGLNKVYVAGELGPSFYFGDNVQTMIGPQVAFNGYMNKKGLTFGGIDIGVMARAAVNISDRFSLNAFALHPLAASPGSKVVLSAVGDDNEIDVKQRGIKDMRYGVGIALKFGGRGY